MILKILRPWRRFVPDQVVEVPDGIASVMLRRRVGVQVECESVSPPENAAMERPTAKTQRHKGYR